MNLLESFLSLLDTTWFSILQRQNRIHILGTFYFICTKCFIFNFVRCDCYYKSYESTILLFYILFVLSVFRVLFIMSPIVLTEPKSSPNISIVSMDRSKNENHIITNFIFSLIIKYWTYKENTLKEMNKNCYFKICLHLLV